MSTDSSTNDPRALHISDAMKKINASSLYGKLGDSYTGQTPDVVYYDEVATINESTWTSLKPIADPIPEDKLTKEKYLEILDKNLELYVKLKEQCHGYFNTISANIMGYNAKINTAKTQEKKRYYSKKRLKIQNGLVELLTRMDTLDSAIKRAQEKKSELLEE